VENNAGEQVWELNDANQDPTVMSKVASQPPVRLRR
jgi:hypothetical protein